MRDYSYRISHEVANFLDYGSRLLERLKTEGQELTYMELRILSTQLGKISTAVKQLDDSRWRGRNNQAA
jgi:hypothetical protein